METERQLQQQAPRLRRSGSTLAEARAVLAKCDDPTGETELGGCRALCSSVVCCVPKPAVLAPLASGGCLRAASVESLV